MILLEDETMNPGEFFKPSDELPQKFSLWMQDETLSCEKVAKEYAATMKRPKYLPLYEMTCVKVDTIERKLVDSRKVEVELTDEEYVFLLTKALLFGTTYRFCHLHSERPELAKKIFTQALDGYPEELKAEGAVYRVVFDEIHENAKEIIQLKNYFFPGDLNKSRIFI